MKNLNGYGLDVNVVTGTGKQHIHADNLDLIVDKEYIPDVFTGFC